MTEADLAANTADAHLPPSLTRLAFHGPLSEARAGRLIERLARPGPGTILDIGCGWGELMLRVLEAAPAATGLGLDTDEGDLARDVTTPGPADSQSASRSSGSPPSGRPAGPPISSCASEPAMRSARPSPPSTP